MSQDPDLSTGTRTYRMAARAEKAAATKRRIIDAASAMLDDGSFHDATLDDLATTAGVTRVTVYRTLGSKQAVFEALAWEQLGRVRLDRLDAAHANPDVRLAVRDVFRENCRMFTELGEALPRMLELAMRDDAIGEVVNLTYHGRRHDAMRRLARRITKEDAARAGWTAKRIAEALIALTSYEVFETLTARTGNSPATAASTLYALASSFLADRD